MAALGLLHGIHREGADGVDGEEIEMPLVRVRLIGVGDCCIGHRRPPSCSVRRLHDGPASLPWKACATRAAHRRVDEYLGYVRSMANGMSARSSKPFGE